jgi:hypothetical protein
MARHVFVAFSSPKEGMEDEFNEWYNNEHVPALMKLDGFVGARRFKLADGVPRNGSPAAPSGQEYLVIYELEADDITGIPGAIGAGVKSGEIKLAPVMDDLNAGYFTQIASTD